MINYSLNADILIKLDNPNMIILYFNGNGFKIIKSSKVNNF